MDEATGEFLITAKNDEEVLKEINEGEQAISGIFGKTSPNNAISNVNIRKY